MWDRQITFSSNLHHLLTALHYYCLSPYTILLQMVMTAHDSTSHLIRDVTEPD